MISSGLAIIERMKEASSAHTLDDLAVCLGEKRSTVGAWSARRSVPLDALVKTSEITKRNLHWLVTGLGPQELPEQTAGATLLGASTVHAAEQPAPWLGNYPVNPDTTQPRDRLAGPSDGLLRSRGATAVLPLVLSIPAGAQGSERRDYEVIPKHVRHAAAGTGKVAEPLQDQLNLAGEMAFSFEWLRRNLGHTSGRLTSIEIRGDSMASTLLDGDTILIDEGVQGVDVDGIYVFDLYGRRLVKRLQQLHDGTLLLISDNPNYQRESVPRDRARDVQVIGRMVWPRVR